MQTLAGAGIRPDERPQHGDQTTGPARAGTGLPRRQHRRTLTRGYRVSAIFRVWMKAPD